MVQERLDAKAAAREDARGDADRFAAGEKATKLEGHGLAPDDPNIPIVKSVAGHADNRDFSGIGIAGVQPQGKPPPGIEQGPQAIGPGAGQGGDQMVMMQMLRRIELQNQRILEALEHGARF